MARILDLSVFRIMRVCYVIVIVIIVIVIVVIAAAAAALEDLGW